MKLFEVLFSRLQPYKGLSLNIYFHNDKQILWEQFLRDYCPKLETIGTSEDSKECFDVADVKIKGFTLHTYGPSRANPNFNISLIGEKRRKEREKQEIFYRFKRELERNPNVKGPIFEGLMEDAQYVKMIQETLDAKPSLNKEYFTLLIAKLKQNGWEVSEDSTPEKLTEGISLIVVKPPNSDMWSLRRAY